MRDVNNGDQPTVFTVVNGDSRTETQISFSSVSVIDREIRVHSFDGNRLDVQMPGMNVALRFDLDAVQQAQPVAEQVPEEHAKPAKPLPLSPFNWKTLLITFVLWNVVGLLSGALGFFVAAGYFGYQWRQIAKRKKQVAGNAPANPDKPRQQPQTNDSAMSRARVRQVLSRKR